ncbi:hypothetical protein OPQ81_000692 [Rhizoctonia solani]|nr:hypothetical protein OPQ81_000692 [Rhizoctonia solani]
MRLDVGSGFARVIHGLGCYHGTAIFNNRTRLPCEILKMFLHLTAQLLTGITRVPLALAWLFFDRRMAIEPEKYCRFRCK